MRPTPKKVWLMCPRADADSNDARADSIDVESFEETDADVASPDAARGHSIELRLVRYSFWYGMVGGDFRYPPYTYAGFQEERCR
jgi:hypothetical protein